MFTWTAEDVTFMKHIQEVMSDRMSDGNDYTEDDRRSLAKLETLADSDVRIVSVIASKAALPRDTETLHLQDIVRAELTHWVPNSSQRLIRRAAVMLDLPVMPVPAAEDHGDDRSAHALIPDWVGGLYLMRCATCNHLFEH